MAQRIISETRAQGAESLGWLAPRLAIALAINAATLVEIGFYDPVLPPTVLRLAQVIGIVLLWTLYVVAYFKRDDRYDWIIARLRELGVLFLASAIIPFWPEAAALFLAVLFILYFGRVYIILAHKITRPGLLLVSSFLILIAMCTALLLLPRATPETNPITFVDSLFTATSAVCVTGLIVRDTATEYTRFGQTIILLFIQLGGLGIAIFGALFASMISGSISLRYATSMQDVVSSAEGGIAEIDRLVRFVVLTTLAFEAVGAAVLMFAWPVEVELSERIYVSVFFAISAFCNAGFAPFTNSLIDFRYAWSPHLVIAPLIVIGGIGFPVLFNLWYVGAARLRILLRRQTPRLVNRDRIVRINLHTKIVLSMTAALYLFGFAGILAGQLTPYLHHALDFDIAANAPELPALTASQLSRHALDASFMSVSARTAGFNTLPMSELTPSAQFMLMLLMWVGGSPGGTAGGVKTVAVAVLLLTIWSTVRGRQESEAFGRSLPDELVRRAGVLAMLGFFTIAATMFALSLTETPRLAHKLFEAVSACGTVGLSLDYTPTLTGAGRIIIIVAMFLGRVGPLAMLGALMFRSRSRARYRYPSERLIMS